MSWKTIGQTASATAELLKYKALQELDGVNALINWTSVTVRYPHQQTRRESMAAVDDV